MKGPRQAGDKRTDLLNNKIVLFYEKSRKELPEAKHKMIQANPEQQAAELQELLDAHPGNRIAVVGATCTGKSTLVPYLRNVDDMDTLVFPKLSRQEADYVCQSPWTVEIGDTMSRLARERVAVHAGRPVIGTVVFDVDLIVKLTISDELLRERATARLQSFDDAKNMQHYVDESIEASGLPVIEFAVG